MTRLARTLTSLRARIRQRMPDLCHVQSVSLEDDGDGGLQETWADTGDELRCVVSRDKGRLHDAGGVPAGKTPFAVAIAGAVAVTSKQRVRVHANDQHGEVIVEIVSVGFTAGALTRIAGLVKI